MTNIVEITAENFQQVLLQQPEQLILVELYSPRDTASAPMSSQLRHLMFELGSRVVLARVDCDAQGQIAGQFGVTSVPTLVLIRAGQPIDTINGVVPIEQIRAMLAKYLPKPEEELLLKASAMLLDESAEINEIFSVIDQAYQLDSERVDIKSCYIEVLVKLGQLEQAKGLLASFALEDQNANYQRLVSMLELAEEAGQSPEIKALEQKLAANPTDNHVKLSLAINYSQANRSEDALELLFNVLQGDLNFEDAKKRYLDIIAALPAGDAAASVYRRKLYSLLH
ncbi:MAG: tetratricopeptide repeat protein [Gammaproteobacteria bacterium]|nr:tetratricopeptide repeat protein [Gammaproteobacteria bacterium]